MLSKSTGVFISTTVPTLKRLSNMHFIEIAANLTDDMFKGMYNGSQRHPPDLDLVMSRARSAGVVKTIVTAGTLSQAEQALDLVQADPSLFCTVGVHPTRASEMGSDPVAYCDKLLKVIQQGGRKVVAVGECGLDYDRTRFCSEEQQLPGFMAQFVLAEKTRLPMFLHNRNTRGDFYRLVKENRSRFTKGVVHSFTGTREEMEALVDLDLYIGVNGCSLKTEANLQVAKAIPLDKLMLETDCPYCEIRNSHAGSSFIKSRWDAKDKKKYSAEAMVKGRSEPCQIRQVCEVLSASKSIPEEDIARAAFNNSMRVFFPEEAENMGSSPYDLSIGAVASTSGT